MKNLRLLPIVVIGALTIMTATLVTAQGPQPQSPQSSFGTAFSYQGQLKLNGVPVSAPLALTFRLYDSASGGVLLGTVTQPITPSNTGLFTTRLDFGGVFDGGDRWLGISIGASPELTPRQQLSAAPYALFAGSAGSASALQGRLVTAAAPAAGDALKWNGNAWAPGDAGVQKTGDTMSGNLSFGSVTRQMLNLWGTAYGIGVQSYALYQRTDNGAGFAWYAGGTHSNTTYDPGTGGKKLLTLDEASLHLPISETLRLDLGTGYKMSLGGNGTLEVDAPGVIGGRMIVKDNGNVGIGNNNPGDKLTVAGTVHSTSGGFMFPDGTTQTSAAAVPAPNPAYTTYSGGAGEIATYNAASATQLAQLSLPAGTYMLFATVDFENSASIALQDNSRQIVCYFYDETRYIKIDAPGGYYDGWYSASWHEVKPLGAQTVVTLDCKVRDGGTDRSYVYAYSIRMSAIKLASLTVQ